MTFQFCKKENKAFSGGLLSRRPLRFLFTVVLISYLLFFSSFALYHIYVADELDQSHGCSIGEWTHLGHQVAAAVFLTAGFLVVSTQEKEAVRFILVTPRCKNHLKRGPPSLLLPV